MSSRQGDAEMSCCIKTCDRFLQAGLNKQLRMRHVSPETCIQPNSMSNEIHELS